MPIITIRNLNVAYTESGPQHGPVTLLLHGWPDDASTWHRVAQELGAAGARTLVPALRGFGETRFRSGSALRTADPGILAMDAIEMMDSLGIERFSVIGHDWGSSIAEAMAVGWPDRIEGIGLVSWSPRLGGLPMPSFEHAALDWYQWFMATPRGEQAIREDRRGFAHTLWTMWGPSGWFDDATFARVAHSWDNPDWLDVTLHSYRCRWGVTEPDAIGAWLVAKVEMTSTLSLPVMVVQGGNDGVSPLRKNEEVRRMFTGPFELFTLHDVGHFPQREAPIELAAHLMTFLPIRGADRR